MSASTYMLKCAIRPPGVVYIKEKKSDNEFCIEITKVPVTYEEYVSKNNEIFVSGDSAKPMIYIKVSLGEGIGDLCSVTQAANMTFTTVEGDGWRMEWLSNSQCFVIYPPSDFDFPKEYSAAFRSSGFYTEAKEGTVNFEAYIKNFTDVENQIAYANLTKRYPIIFDSFSAKPDLVNLGDSVTLSWRVLNAEKCFLLDGQGMRQVDTEDSRVIKIDKPDRFYLSAENDMGMTSVMEQDVKCIKPSIEFTAKPAYYHSGDKVKLKWHATSAKSVLISPSLGEMPPEGECDYWPESPYITASASGYNGFDQTTVIKSISLKQTPWKNMGTVTGVDLSKDTLNSDRRVSEWNGSLYLFCDKTLYRSKDGLVWESVSTLKLELDMSLGAYSTVITRDKFYVLGIKKEKSVYIHVAVYNLIDNKDWQINPAINNSNRDVLNGAIAKVKDSPYFTRDKGSMLLYYTPDVDFNNEWILSFDLNEGITDCFDIAGSDELLYTASYLKDIEQLTVTKVNPELKNFEPSGKVTLPEQKWVSLIATISEIYILMAESMLNLDNFREVSGFHPKLDVSYKPYTGSMNNTPMLITKDGTLWCCYLNN